MRPLDPSFPARVRETSLGLAGILFLVLCTLPDARIAASFAAGVGLAVLLWWVTERLVLGAGRECWRVRDIAGVVGLYLLPLAVAALYLWQAVARGWLAPVAFTVGFSLPGLVVFLKAIALGGLPQGAEPAPVYSAWRKAAGGE